MSHTPGPWSFQTVEPGARLTMKRRHWAVGQAALPTVPAGVGVALVFGDDDTNARLIAAAPQMQRLLVEAVNLLPVHDPFGCALTGGGKCTCEYGPWHLEAQALLKETA